MINGYTTRWGMRSMLSAYRPHIQQRSLRCDAYEEERFQKSLSRSIYDRLKSARDERPRGESHAVRHEHDEPQDNHQHSSNGNTYSSYSSNTYSYLGSEERPREGSSRYSVRPGEQKYDRRYEHRYDRRREQEVRVDPNSDPQDPRYPTWAPAISTETAPPFPTDPSYVPSFPEPYQPAAAPPATAPAQHPVAQRLMDWAISATAAVKAGGPASLPSFTMPTLPPMPTLPTLPSFPKLDFTSDSKTRTSASPISERVLLTAALAAVTFWSLTWGITNGLVDLTYASTWLMTASAEATSPGTPWASATHSADVVQRAFRLAAIAAGPGAGIGALWDRPGLPVPGWILHEALVVGHAVCCSCQAAIVAIQSAAPWWLAASMLSILPVWAALGGCVLPLHAAALSLVKAAKSLQQAVGTAHQLLAADVTAADAMGGMGSKKARKEAERLAAEQREAEQLAAEQAEQQQAPEAEAPHEGAEQPQEAQEAKGSKAAAAAAGPGSKAEVKRQLLVKVAAALALVCVMTHTQAMALAPPYLDGGATWAGAACVAVSLASGLLSLAVGLVAGWGVALVSCCAAAVRGCDAILHACGSADVRSGPECVMQWCCLCMPCGHAAHMPAAALSTCSGTAQARPCPLQTLSCSTPAAWTSC